MRISRAAIAATLAAPFLAACSGGGPDPEVAHLRARADAQTQEIDALGRQVRALEARSKEMEEQFHARSGAPAAAVVASPAKPAEGEAATPGGPEPLTGEVAVTAEAVGTFLDTEQGRTRIREAIAAEEKRKQEEQRAQRREQTMSFIKERVSGSLGEALGLDAKQQQTVITIASDTMEKMEDIWRGARDGQGNPQGFADARQKTQEVMSQAQKDLQQALTVDQYTKLQEMNAEGTGLFPGRGMGSIGGFGGRGPGGQGGAGGGGGATQSPGGAR
jgi:hypothetical protein